ncbi:MAG: BrnA antitoxin family protein [Campylobacterales bacterium]|nr:BrnA antitoxin family protein [Campylobacterales bacterium]
MKPTKTIPIFENEAQERAFWENHDTTEYFDTSKAKKARFSNLKKSTKSISIRLPVGMIEELKVKANSIDIPYQSLIKMLLQKGLSEHQQKITKH